MRRLILLIGPTCTGKSTLEKELNRRGIPSVVSYTTRTPRTGEVHGKDYYFLTQQGVEDLEAAGQVIQKVCFAGNYYGSTTAALDDAYAVCNDAVIVVEPTGLTQFQAYAATVGDIEIVSVYLDNSLSTLVARLVARWHTDANGDAAYYWQRLTDLVKQHQEWPSYIENWTHFVQSMDEDGTFYTVQTAADLILGSSVR